MFYETSYRNPRVAGAIAVLLILMGVAFLFGFLFISYDSGVSDGVEDFNWLNIAIFIPVFGGSFVSIMAAISAQKQKRNASLTVPKEPLGMKIEEAPYERVYKQSDRIKKPNIVYCNYCGEKIEKEALFCPQCGTKMRL